MSGRQCRCLHFFVLSWVLYDLSLLPPFLCFWCLLISFSHCSSRLLPGSEPNPRVRSTEKHWPFGKDRGPQGEPNGLSALPGPAPSCPPSQSISRTCSPTVAKPREDGIRCVGMALLLWKPALRNRSELIHSGAQAGLGGGGEAKLCTLNFALLLLPCDAGQVT